MGASRSLPESFDGGLLAFAALPEGTPDDVDKGLLNQAGRLAGILGCGWGAVCFPGNAREDVPEDDSVDPAKARVAAGGLGVDPAPFGVYGVSEVVAVSAERDLADYPEAQAQALASAARAWGAALVLLPHNGSGSAIAPALAVRLEAALITEVLAFNRVDEGLHFHRRVLGGRAVERRLWTARTPLVATVDPKVLSPVVWASVRPARPTVRELFVETGADGFRTRIVERVPPDPQTVDVSEAEVIFCAGKGFDPESFERFRELARLLNASLGATRPVYDAGWVGFERMIGQTGKTVVPRFYLGMGISGSMHHVGGIKDAKRLVSVNLDPKAPMFPNSDEGFVADLREVLPLLLEKVRARVGEGGAS